jgi:hypothetical protein
MNPVVAFGVILMRYPISCVGAKGDLSTIHPHYFVRILKERLDSINNLFCADILFINNDMNKIGKIKQR